MKKICFVGYSNHKATNWRGRWVSPHVDSEILSKNSCKKGVFTIGHPVENELIQSNYISNRPNFFAIIINFFRAGKIKFRDIAYIFQLYRENQHSSMNAPLPKWLWYIWPMRAYIVARHFSYVFKDISEEYDEARVIVYYNAAMLGVVFAFRSRGKPVYDIQHGYIGPSHNAYNKSKAIVSNSPFSPSGYVVWDEGTAKYMVSLGAQNIEVVGFRHLCNFSTPSAKGRHIILVTTQHFTPLPNFLYSVVSAFPNIMWRFRFHPLERQVREDIKAFKALQNVEIANPGRSLADDLLESVLHLTVHSSSVHEAAALNVVSLFTDELGNERFSREIAKGMALFVDAESAERTVGRLLAANKAPGSGTYAP